MFNSIRNHHENKRLANNRAERAERDKVNAAYVGFTLRRWQTNRRAIYLPPQYRSTAQRKQDRKGRHYMLTVILIVALTILAPLAFIAFSPYVNSPHAIASHPEENR